MKNSNVFFGMGFLTVDERASEASISTECVLCSGQRRRPRLLRSPASLRFIFLNEGKSVSKNQ